jgi:hypothetical protein
VLHEAVSLLERRLQESDQKILLEVFRRYDLEPENETISYRELARQLGVTEGAVRRYLWRARQEFRKAVTEVIAQTVDNETDFTREMKEFYGD